MRQRVRGITAPVSKTSRGVESICESGFAKSRKKFFGASSDRAKTEFSRKYFCCQNLRLRVRETCFSPTAELSAVLKALRCALYCDERNRCGTGVSLMCDVASVTCFLRVMDGRADALRCFRFVFAARAAPWA